MEIILIRHGEVEANLSEGLESGLEDELTPKGFLQALSMANALLPAEIGAILCSPLPRAVQTVEPFSKKAKLDIELVPGLAEGHLMLEDHIEPQAPEYYVHESIGQLPLESESHGQFFMRIKQSLDLIQQQDAKRVLVVSHGHAIREMINQLLELPKRVRFPHGNCHATSITLSVTKMVNYINRNIAAV
jgi:broad specificity phosphatase PhoE